jgi:murein L,D-transpeptidase YcbB/YkuD
MRFVPEIRVWIVLTVFSFYILTACGTSGEEIVDDIVTEEKIPIEERLKACIQPEALEELGLDPKLSVWLTSLYDSLDFKPIWINEHELNEKGLKLDSSLNHSIWFGVPRSRIRFNDKKEDRIVVKEVFCTVRSALMLHDLNYGMIVDSTKKFGEQRLIDRVKFDSLMTLPDSISVDQFFLRQGPSDTNYRFLADHLYQYVQKYPLNEKTFEVKPIKEDSVGAIPKSRQALFFKGYLLDSLSDEQEFMQALKAFQKDNGLKPDGKIGKYTSRALNESTLNKVYRAALALDKYRTQIKYPSKYIFVNLPEYILRYYVRDSLKSMHRIVIGTEVNQTPQLKSKVYQIMVYPFWNVPYSISSKEILPAVRYNTGYLKKNNYKIYRKEVEVDPYKVNWKKIRKDAFPYKVVQQPGPKNSLGIIKFEFHNKYSVYIHDTPSKGFFNSDVRSFSHGCMRCENPVELGRILLANDSLRRKANPMIADSLDTFLGRAQNLPIRLIDPIPVFVEYRSVCADRDKLVFYVDIYGRDEEYLKAFR